VVDVVVVVVVLDEVAFVSRRCRSGSVVFGVIVVVVVRQFGSSTFSRTFTLMCRLMHCGFAQLSG